MITKVRSHLSQNEPLLFERSSPGKKAYQLPELDVPPVDAAEALGAENVRDAIDGFPEVSEVETIRHFTRLSRFYPELSDCMLLCATEMSRRADMDHLGQVIAQPAAAEQLAAAEVLA